MSISRNAGNLEAKEEFSYLSNSSAECILKTENYTSNYTSNYTRELKFDYHCLLKHLTRKIKSTVSRRFDASSIILKIDVVHVNIKVVI